MSGLAAVLAGHEPAGVYRWHAAFDVPEVRHTVEQTDHRFGYVDGWVAGTKAEVLAAIGEALGFPDTYGQNLDALEDSLRADGIPIELDGLERWQIGERLLRARLQSQEIPAIERAGFMRQISAKIRENVDEIARVISEEQGKVLDLARVEAAFTAAYLDYMAEWARRIEGEIITSDRANEQIFLLRKPLGVVAGILP